MDGLFCPCLNSSLGLAWTLVINNHLSFIQNHLLSSDLAGSGGVRRCRSHQPFSFLWKLNFYVAKGLTFYLPRNTKGKNNFPRSLSALLGFLEQAKFCSTISDVHTSWSIHNDKIQNALSGLPLPKMWGYIFVALTSKNKRFTILPSFSASALSQMQIK